MFIAFVRKEESGLRKLVSIVFIGSLLGIFLFLIVNTLNKRSDREIKDDNNKPYITITETVSSEGNNPETKSNCYEYDIDKKTLVKRGEVPYTAGYPLTLYSRSDKSILYIAYSGMGDQVFRKRGRNTSQITKDFCAFNHMFICNGQVFMAAKFLKKYCIEPVLLDLNTNSIRKLLPDKNDDTFTWSATCDPQNDTIVFSCYSDSEMRALLDVYSGDPENGEYPLNPKSTIYEYDLKEGKIRKIYETKDYLFGIGISGKNLYYSGAKSSLSNKDNTNLIHVSLSSGAVEKVDCPIHITGDMFIVENDLYCVGWFNNVRGCYKYDFIKREVETVLLPEETSFINGISLSY